VDREFIRKQSVECGAVMLSLDIAIRIPLDISHVFGLANCAGEGSGKRVRDRILEGSADAFADAARGDWSVHQEAAIFRLFEKEAMCS
jgi:hypothetical protein